MKPKKVLVDLTRVFQAAQGYVMISRVQSLEQLFILNEVPTKKLYADVKALREIERLESVSINQNPSTWNVENKSLTKIAFLNIQSINTKLDWIECDHSLLRADVIFLSETWLDENDINVILPGYSASVNSVGRGHGTATFYRGNYTIEEDIHVDRINVIKISSKTLDVICVYRSSDGNLEVLVDILKGLINSKKNCVIGGDFNLDLNKNRSYKLTTFLTSQKFKQLVDKSTHIDGGLIDHCYLRILNGESYEVEVMPKVYSDHDALCFSLFEL